MMHDTRRPEPAGTIHAARRSDRLYTVLLYLILCGSAGATTRDIIEVCGVCAVNTIVSELRQNGHTIKCRRSKSATGRTVYVYSLEASPLVSIPHD
jgi:hypothetical protein